MPYIDPLTVHDPTTGAIAPASWGDAVRNAVDLLAVTRAKAVVRRASPQTISHDTDTLVSFDTEDVDRGGMWTGAAPTRLTIPADEGGVWLIGARGQWETNSTNARAETLLVSGSGAVVYDARPTGGQHESFAFSVMGLLVATQYMTLQVYHNSGAGLDLLNATLWALQVESL